VIGYLHDSRQDLIAFRAQEVELPAIRKIGMQAEKMVDAIHLEKGEPDFKTPDHIIESAKAALDEGYTHYTSTAGMLELREAIAAKLQEENMIEVDPNSEIIITLGSQEALFAMMQALINPGDEAIILDPSYNPIYESSVRLSGGIIKSLPIIEEKNFQVDAEEIEPKISSKTKLILICNPNNPTGSLFDLKTLKEISKVAIRHNLVVISDEIYEKIIYDGVKHHSIASLPNMKEHTITINGFSKTYAMTGWRIGYIAANKPLCEQILKVHYYISICANSISQKAALAALLGPQDCVKKMVKEYDRRRRLILNEINRIEGVHCLTPKGAFYVFPKISEFGLSSEELAQHILKKARVATVPGSGFGRFGEGHLRLSFSVSQENIKKAIERIRIALEKLPRT